MLLDAEKKKIEFPGMPGFLLNTATETLLKKDFDKYRELQQPHPFMESNSLGHLTPFKHEYLGLPLNYYKSVIIQDNISYIAHEKKEITKVSYVFI